MEQLRLAEPTNEMCHQIVYSRASPLIQPSSLNVRLEQNHVLGKQLASSGEPEISRGLSSSTSSPISSAEALASRISCSTPFSLVSCFHRLSTEVPNLSYSSLRILIRRKCHSSVDNTASGAHNTSGQFPEVTIF